MLQPSSLFLLPAPLPETPVARRGRGFETALAGFSTSLLSVTHQPVLMLIYVQSCVQGRGAVPPAALLIKFINLPPCLIYRCSWLQPPPPHLPPLLVLLNSPPPHSHISFVTNDTMDTWGQLELYMVLM